MLLMKGCRGRVSRAHEGRRSPTATSVHGRRRVGWAAGQQKGMDEMLWIYSGEEGGVLVGDSARSGDAAVDDRREMGRHDHGRGLARVEEWSARAG